MRLLTYVLKSANVLNLILIAAGVSAMLYLVYPVLNANVTYKAPPVAKEAPAAKEEKNAASPPPADYTVVAEQNLFHPERKIPPESKDEKALPKPELLLYGTLLADNLRLAYIEDKKAPQSSPGRGPRQTVVKQGDTISGFLLTSVEADRIVLVRGEEQLVVFLSDAKKPRSVVTPAQPPGTQRPAALPGAQATPVPTTGVQPQRPPRTTPTQ